MLKSDNARLVNHVYVDVARRDLGSVVRDLQRTVAGKTAAAGYGGMLAAVSSDMAEPEHGSRIRNLVGHSRNACHRTIRSRPMRPEGVQMYT